LHIHAQPVPDEMLKLTQLFLGVIASSANQPFESVAETMDATNANKTTTNEYEFIMRYNVKNCLCCFDKYKRLKCNMIYIFILYIMIEQTNISASDPPARNAILVALEIIQIIPEDKTDFYKDIHNLIHNDYVYKDRTALQTPYNWLKLQDIMYKHIPTPDEEWKEKIVNVYIGKLLY